MSAAHRPGPRPARRPPGVSYGPFPARPTGQLADYLRPAARPLAPEDVAAWLLEVLDGSDVVLADFDRGVIGDLAAASPEIVHVVAGWVARARTAGRTWSLRQPRR